MNATKVTFSTEELSLMQNSNWILTKNLIMEKVQLLFSDVLEQVKPLIKSTSLSEILVPNPKIFKGEAYENLPWVMMDYPRLFGKIDCFAIRNFYWWGNFYSCTLQLTGKYKTIITRQFLEELSYNNETYIGNNDNPWLHNFRPDNYEILNNKNLENFSTKNYSTIKLAQKFNLNNPQTAAENIILFYKTIFSYLNDEIVP